MRPGVILCRCERSGLIDRGKLRVIEASLKDAGIQCNAVSDLCGLAASRDPLLADLAGGGSTHILACYPRAVRALFALAGAALKDGATEIINLRTVEGSEALSRLGVDRAMLAPEPPGESGAVPDGGWMPWFPVIDYSRCTNCQQCLGFCLFGVYSADKDGKVVVENPQGCKTNCPACARICPQVAIIFPKYESGAIAGGEILDESVEQRRIETDKQQILGSDVYAALAERRKKAQTRQLLKSQAEIAHQERQKHLGASEPRQAPNAGAGPGPRAESLGNDESTP